MTHMLRFPSHPTTALVAILLAAAVLPAAARAQVTQTPPTQPQVQAIPETQIEIFTREKAEQILSLEETIQLALDQSFNVFQLKQNYLRSAYSLEAAQRALRTQVTFDGTLPSIRQGINAQLVPSTTGTSLEYLRNGSSTASAAFNIIQPLITNGRITFTTSMSANDGFQELTGGRRTDNRSFQPSVGIRYTQPLFQYNDIKGTLLNAQLSFEQLQRSYTQDELNRINQVTNQFYQLFRQQRTLELRAQSFQQSEYNYQTGVRKYQAGLIAEVDYLRLEVRRGQDLDALESAKNSHQQQQFAFNRLVGLPLETRIWVDASLDFRAIKVDLDQAMELAFTNRSEVRSAQITLELSELSLQSTISNGRPNLQMSLGYDLRGNSTLGGYGPGDSWGDHVSGGFDPDNRSPNTNISLTLSIPIFDWGRNAANVQRQIASMRTQERQIEETSENLRRDVINRVNAVTSAMRRLDVLQKSVTVAETSYDISQKRNERGEITLTDLLNAQNELNTAQNSYLDALIDFETAKASLKEITLWDWETNVPAQQRTTPPRPFEVKDRWKK
jgi:outer membrane protein